jgi:hypothetical protein
VHAAGKTNLSAIDKELQKGSLPAKGCDSRLQSDFDSVGVECLTNELDAAGRFSSKVGRIWLGGG